MKQAWILIFLCSIFNCKNGVYSDKEKYITTENGNTNVLYKNSYENGEIKDSIAALKYNQGIELSSWLNYAEAKKQFKNADRIEPDNLIILNALGNVCTDLKEFNKSNEYYEKALSLDSTFWLTYLNYGFSKARNDQFNKALELYNKGLSFERRGEKRAYFYYNMSKAHYQLYEDDKAKQFVDKAAELITDEYLKKEVISFRKTVYGK